MEVAGSTTLLGVLPALDEVCVGEPLFDGCRWSLQLGVFVGEPSDQAWDSFFERVRLLRLLPWNSAPVDRTSGTIPAGADAEGFVVGHSPGFPVNDAMQLRLLA
ncbi:hypothetical protein MRX96_042365 [Rhipicephalus microplus]